MSPAQYNLTVQPHGLKHHSSDVVFSALAVKDDIDGTEQQDDDAAAPKFVRSKWETVDESELEAQGNRLLELICFS